MNCRISIACAALAASIAADMLRPRLRPESAGLLHQGFNKVRSYLHTVLAQSLSQSDLNRHPRRIGILDVFLRIANALVAQIQFKFSLAHWQVITGPNLIEKLMYFLSIGAAALLRQNRFGVS